MIAIMAEEIQAAQSRAEIQAEYRTQLLNELADEVAQTAQEKGFWDDSFYTIPLKLALIASEVSEALAVHREEYDGEDLPDSGMTPRQEMDFCEELADIIIRTLDVAGYYHLDIGYLLTEKMAKNKERPRKHGKRY